MFRTIVAMLVGAYVLGAAIWIAASGVVRTGGEVELLNVACDPTRELWHDVNALFISHYEQKHGVKLTIRQSHGGSGSQARNVIDGLQADVVTLALWTDTDAIRKKGLIDAGWENRFENRSLPYVSTIVFVVRRGNPKQIHDWSDLARPDIRIITPNPKTSGNGKWSFLAAWGSVLENGGTEEQARELVKQLYRPGGVLDTSALGAVASFAEKKIGDVHLTWENEAYIERDRFAKEGLEIVYPKSSILAEPHVAVVDSVVRSKGTTAIAEAYVKFLYAIEAQEVIAKHYYRPTNEAVKKRTASRFPALKLFPASSIEPNWDTLQKRFFAEGGEFDQMLASHRK